MVTPLECGFTDLMLFDMATAETDCPTIRWLESDTSIRADSDMRALDGAVIAARDGAPMSTHPCPMCRTFACSACARMLALKLLWKRGPEHVSRAPV
jgi:hypothetical protein